MGTGRKDSKGRCLRKGESERADGRYMYRYTEEGGKRVTIYNRDLKKLREEEKEIERRRYDGILTGSRLTLNDLYKIYIEGKTELKSGTRENYNYLYRHFAQETLGKKYVRNIRYSDIRSFYTKLAERGLSINTIDAIHTVIHPVLTLAVRDNLILRNPSDRAMADLRKSRKNKPRNPRRALTLPEQERLLYFVEHSDIFYRWFNLITVFLGTGCRIGELAGLRWCDLDFSQNLISINHNCVYLTSGKKRGYFHITTPKTAAGTREIPMLSEVRRVFLQERERQMREGFNQIVLKDEKGESYSDFIFTNRSNRLYTATVIDRALKRIVTAYNKEEKEKAKQENREPLFLPRFSVHQLRHTFCTRLCENESNLKVIQSVMGHADIQTTMNIYAEVTREKRGEAMKNLEGKLGIK